MSTVRVAYAVEQTRTALRDIPQRDPIEALKQWIAADEAKYPEYAEAYAIVLREIIGEEAYVAWAAARRLGI